jgi:TrbL/VirB6 plasmid conjugal transfer protein
MRTKRRHVGKPAESRPPRARPGGEKQSQASASTAETSRHPGRRRRRVRTAILLGVVAIFAFMLRAAMPGQAGQPSAAPGSAGHPVAAVTTAARQPAALSGGLCSVPGIGDIGSLVNLCTLGSSGLIGDLNNVCQPSLPDPEAANSGIDSMIAPPAEGKQPATLYGSYGVAGQYWAATNLQCSDMTSLIGNNVAGMVFDIAKAIDRVTITVYQAAAGGGILNWLTSVVNRLITALGNAIYFTYLAPVVILGTMWLAWQGLIRKRATRTIEGTIWMVVACTAAIWLIGRPADFTGMGADVSNGITSALNTAFSNLPATNQSSCLPVASNDPQVQPASYGSPSGNDLVAQNANDLWTVLVCKPWLAGEFGTTQYSPPGSPPTPVNTYARQLLWAQAIATNEKPTSALIQAKQSTYAGISASIQQNDPSVYPLFQGKEWTTRLEIGFAALFAAAIAGVLVLLISVTLILLKLGFLLLLITGPFFLLIGTHPGFGRVIAIRWFEMLVGVLLKQAAVALVLSVLLYAYALIMGTSDAALPWGLKILMIALVTIAVFIYRRPFQHLFSAVGYGMIGSTERTDVEMQRIRRTMPANRLAAAASALPSLANYRAALLARRGSGAAAAAAAATGAPAATGTATDGQVGQVADGNGTAAGAGGDGGRAGGRGGLSLRNRNAGPTAGNGQGRPAPPLNLPSRGGTAGAAAGAGAGTARPAPAASPPPRSGSGSPASGSSSSPASAPNRASWPMRPGPSQQQSQVPSGTGRPPTSSAPASSGRSGAWSDMSAGRTAGPSARPPGPPPAASPPPAAPASGAARQPVRRPSNSPSRGRATDADAPRDAPGDGPAPPPASGPSWMRPRRRK